MKTWLLWTSSRRSAVILWELCNEHLSPLTEELCIYPPIETLTRAFLEPFLTHPLSLEDGSSGMFATSSVAVQRFRLK